MCKVNWEQKFSDIIEHNKQNLYEICKLCIACIEEDMNLVQEGFQYFLTQVKPPYYDSDEIPDSFLDINESELDDATQDRLEKTERQIVKELIFKDVPEDIFYKEIWKRMSDTLLVSNDYQKSFFLLCMWLDPRIPYYQLGLGVDISSEDYKDYIQKMDLPYKKMIFIMSAGYPKRTQMVSVLMKIADEFQDQNERIVFWSLVIRRLERRISDLENYIQELENLIDSEDTQEE